VELQSFRLAGIIAAPALPSLRPRRRSSDVSVCAPVYRLFHRPGSEKVSGRMATIPFSAIKDSVHDIALHVVDETLNGKVYRSASVQLWSDSMLREILRRLAQEQFPDFKFVVSCFILTTEPNGMCTVTRSLWDRKADGSAIVEWKNRTIQCIVVVYGVKY
jgi:hypothetical protein